jgi:hypothetical protein
VDPSPSALASLIHVYGLLCAGNQEAIPYILQMYSKASCEAKHQKKTFPPNEAFKWRFSHANQIRIKFCGLWDTVSSYGWIYDPIQQPFLGCNPIIDIGRHAVSIHERHCFYKDNLWGTPDPTQDFRQVWFSGTHSDIGGSYPEKTSGLSKIAFEWMLVEAAKAGLRIDEARARVILGKATPSPSVEGLPQFAAPDENACLHHSLHGAWWFPELLPQQDPHLHGKRLYFPLGCKRTIPEDSYIHQSVIDGKYTPERLPKHTVEPLVTFEAYCAKRAKNAAPLYPARQLNGRISRPPQQRRQRLAPPMALGQD